MKLKLFAALLLAGGLSAGLAQADELRDKAAAAFKPLPSTVPVVKDNKITPEKITLGKALYFDTRMSKSGFIACASCHNLSEGGDDNQATSTGHGWQKGPRNAPTVLNAVFNIAQFWDGRADDLKAQAKGPVQAAGEMANNKEQAVATLKSMPQYGEWFKAAFPEDKDPVTFDNFAKAVEAFEATLITPAPFDAYLNGDDSALSADQKKGLALFIDKGCSSCHNGVNVGGDGYYPFGVVEKPGSDILPVNDKGRFAVTKTADDQYVFRVAPLRNVALTAPYFHSGQVWDLKQAVGVMGASQLGAALSDDEENAIVAFLGSLTGKMPEVTLPVLPAETADTPRPDFSVTK